MLRRSWEGRISSLSLARSGLVKLPLMLLPLCEAESSADSSEYLCSFSRNRMRLNNKSAGKVIRAFVWNLVTQYLHVIIYSPQSHTSLFSGRWRSAVQCYRMWRFSEGFGFNQTAQFCQNYPQHHSQESRGEKRGKSSAVVFRVRQTQGKILLLLPIGCVESGQIQLIIRILRDAVRKQWSWVYNAQVTNFYLAHTVLKIRKYP